MSDELMTIRQMCDAFEVTPRTLRFYEAKELLFPIREGQKRLFTRRDRARLKLILRAKRYEFSLEEIRQVLDLYHEDDSQRAQIALALKIGKSHLESMIQRQQELSEAIADLTQEVEWAEKVLSSVEEPRAAE